MPETLVAERWHDKAANPLSRDDIRIFLGVCLMRSSITGHSAYAMPYMDMSSGFASNILRLSIASYQEYRRLDRCLSAVDSV